MSRELIQPDVAEGDLVRSLARDVVVVWFPIACLTPRTLQSARLTDGMDALPGTVECLEELRAKGKRLVILSNTSKREAYTMQRLPRFGFRAELFDGGVTSGEVSAYRSLALPRDRSSPPSILFSCNASNLSSVESALEW